MCLALPGRIVSIQVVPPPGVAMEEPGAEGLWRLAVVDFGGVRQPVSLACLPEAQLGDQVLVHVGMALTIVQEEQA